MGEKEKKTIDEDPNVYKVLAMLFESIVVREHEKMMGDDTKLMNQPLLISGKTNMLDENCARRFSATESMKL